MKNDTFKEEPAARFIRVVELWLNKTRRLAIDIPAMEQEGNSSVVMSAITSKTGPEIDLASRTLLSLLIEAAKICHVTLEVKNVPKAIAEIYTFCGFVPEGTSMIWRPKQ